MKKMKQFLLILSLLISFSACSNGQTKHASTDYSKDIIGCWRAVKMGYVVKSNYSLIDSLILEESNKTIEGRTNKLHAVKFFDSHMNEFDENGKASDNPSIYSLKGDTLSMRGTYRQDESVAKITIVNDSLFLELDAAQEFRRISNDLRWDQGVDIPQDLKLEKMVRYVTCIRIKDCSKYTD